MNRSISIGAALALAATLCGSAKAAPLSFWEFSEAPGWAIYDSSAIPGGALDAAGIVHLKGALQGHIGASPSPFTLPFELRPNKNVYVPINLSDGQPGRLAIYASGVVYVQAPPPGNTLSYVSLEGVTYTKLGPPLHYTALTLINSWHPYGEISSTRAPAGAVDANNIVHLKGAMYRHDGNNSHPFVLPLALRPNKVVYLPIDLVNANPGQLTIQPNGTVSVLAAGPPVNAQSFTSLEGVTYSRSGLPLHFTAIPLAGGWKPYGNLTRVPSGAIDSEGVVHLQGAMHEPTGKSALPFVLPPALRPSRDVLVRIDLLNGKVGRLNIHPDGSVGLQTVGSFASAQSFASLEGVSYPKK
jgi:hypothetical protein